MFSFPIRMMLETLSLYISLFAVSLLSSTIVPLFSEGALIYMIVSGHNAAAVVIVATIGNTLGSIVNYYVGYYGEKTILSRYIKHDQKKLKKAKTYFDRYGSPVLLFSWVPVIGDGLTLFAGLVMADLRKFTFYVFIGKLVRYLVIAMLLL